MAKKKSLPPEDPGREPFLEQDDSAHDRRPYWPGLFRATLVGMIQGEPVINTRDDGVIHARVNLHAQYRPPSVDPQRPSHKVEYVPGHVDCYGQLAIYVRNTCEPGDLCLAEGRMVWSTSRGLRLVASHFMVLHYGSKGLNTRMIHIRRILWDHVWTWALRGGMDPKDPLASFLTEDDAPKNGDSTDE